MSSIVTFFLSKQFIQVVILLAVASLLSLVGIFFYCRLAPYFKRKGYLWREAIVESLHRPSQVLIWLMASVLIAAIIIQYGANGSSYVEQVFKVKKVLVLIFVLWVSMRLVSRIESSYLLIADHAKSKLKDRTKINALAQVIRVAVIAMVALIILPTLGIPISALLTFGGVAGVAFGFAAKDTLANFLGGLMIYWDRPFSVGDWVSSPDRQIEGTVEKIGWRLTRIRRFDKRVLYVPNGAFSNVSIENPSRMSNRRIKAVIGLRYSDIAVVKQILEDIESMLRNNDNIDSKQTLFARFFEFGESSLNFTLYTFTKTTNWVEFECIRQEVLLSVAEIVAKHGAEFAFPSRTVYISGQDTPLSMEG